MRIGFLGGDARMRIPAAKLLGRGHSVCSLAPIGVGVSAESAKELCAFSDILVFPTPASRDARTVAGTSLTVEMLPIEQRHADFGGYFPKNWRFPASKVFDCAFDESFLLRNAALTADGGIAAALSATERAFYGCRIAVIGYGRIAKMLLRRLSGFGVPVTVYARRREALADAALSGFSALPLEGDTLFSENIIFNTVPESVFGGVRVKAFAHVFDLGGGMPSRLLGQGEDSYPVTSMRGVPGVFAPTAAGEIIFDALSSFLSTL